jgi:stearoyl-CoA 9-desaturase NADPH oxidoreductase
VKTTEVILLRPIEPSDQAEARELILAGLEQHWGFRDASKNPDLDEICTDWREREAFHSGPTEMLDKMEEYWEKEGDVELLHAERFQPKQGLVEEGEGGEIKFLTSEVTTEAQGGTPILVAGEECGLELDYGCREGVCHTCVGTLCSGKVRDLRNGNVYGTDGETIRTCISAPEGPVEIDL